MNFEISPSHLENEKGIQYVKRSDEIWKRWSKVKALLCSTGSENVTADINCIELVQTQTPTAGRQSITFLPCSSTCKLAIFRCTTVSSLNTLTRSSLLSEVLWSSCNGKSQQESVKTYRNTHVHILQNTNDNHFITIPARCKCRAQWHGAP